MGTDEQSECSKERPEQYELFEQLGLEPSKYLLPSQGPTMVHTADAFLRATCFESHVDDVIVLAGGLDKLGLASSLPGYVLEAASASRSTLEFCHRLGQHRGLEHFDAYLSRFPEGHETLVSRDSQGDRLDDLGEMCEEACKAWPDERYYISELGRYSKRDHPLTQERTRCLLDADVRDVCEKELGVELPIWERGNAFVGESGTGSCVHVDKVCWSNVGKNWTGYKLFCVWRIGAQSTQILAQHYKKIMSAPFSDTDIEALKMAVKVCLLVPGDVYVFCGACAHMAVTVGPALNVSGYEALVNFNKRSLATFTVSGTPEHLEAEQASKSAMYEWKQDAVHSLIDAAQYVHRGTLPKELLSEAIEQLCTDRECCQLFDEFSAHCIKKHKVNPEPKDVIEAVTSVDAPGPV